MRQGYEYRSDFARQYFGEGQLKARRTDVLIFLEARGLDIPATLRERIETCSDLDELERLIRRAAIVKAAGELFE